MHIYETEKTLRGLTAALFVVICWSGFNIVSRLGTNSGLTPFDLAALRFSVAGAITLPLFCAVFYRSSMQQRVRFLIVALFGSVGYALAAYNGFEYAPVAHAGVIINGGIPLFTVLIAWVAFQHRPAVRNVVSLLIALIGILLISVASFSEKKIGESLWKGDLFFVYASISWAIAGLLMRRWHLKPIDTTVMMAGFSALIFLPIYVLWLPKNIESASIETLVMQGFYQGAIAATLSGFFYNYANQTIGPHKASLMLALVPGVSAILAIPILNETLTGWVIAGILFVTIGAIIGAIHTPRKKG